MTQTLTINLHNPNVIKVDRHSSGGVIVADLGNGQYHGTVAVFFDGVEAVDEFIAALQAGVAQYRFMKETA